MSAWSHRQPADHRRLSTVSWSRVDYADRFSLKRALAGVDTLVFPGGIGEPAQMLADHQAVVAAAAHAEVRRVVYLSCMDADPGSPFSYARVHAATEQLLHESKLQVEVLRASVFSEFFLATFVKPALREGSLRLPAGDASVAFISRTDVGAALAAAALHERSDVPPFRNITGPESVTLDTVAILAAGLTGQRFRYEPVTVSGYRSTLNATIERRWLTEAFVGLWTSVGNGAYTAASDGFSALVGRTSQTMAEVATRGLSPFLQADGRSVSW